MLIDRLCWFPHLHIPSSSSSSSNPFIFYLIFTSLHLLPHLQIPLFSFSLLRLQLSPSTFILKTSLLILRSSSISDYFIHIWISSITLYSTCLYFSKKQGSTGSLASNSSDMEQLRQVSFCTVLNLISEFDPFFFRTYYRTCAENCRRWRTKLLRVSVD